MRVIDVLANLALGKRSDRDVPQMRMCAHTRAWARCSSLLSRSPQGDRMSIRMRAALRQMGFGMFKRQRCQILPLLNIAQPYQFATGAATLSYMLAGPLLTVPQTPSVQAPSNRIVCSVLPSCVSSFRLLIGRLSLSPRCPFTDSILSSRPPSSNPDLQKLLF